MRRFLYFIPGQHGANREILRAAGLLDRFIDSAGDLVEHQMLEVDVGPRGNADAGRRGVIVAAGGHGPFYECGKQPWIDGPIVSVGIEGEAPRPDDLVREKTMISHPAKLVDGNVWRVPVLHRWEGGNVGHVPNFPKCIKPVMVDGRYQTRTEIRPEFKALDELAARIFAGFLENRTMPEEEAFQTCATILGVNYRLGVEECGLLGLFDPPAMRAVMGAAVDEPSIAEAVAAARSDGLEIEPLPED